MNDAPYIHMIQLQLDRTAVPHRGAFADVMARLAALGVMDCIELAIAPEGGGRLAFVLHRDDTSERIRAELTEMLGADAIVDCRTRPC